MNSKTIIKQFLDKIINSAELNNSKTDQEYLTYLVQETLKGHDLKETTIAFDFFKKGKDFNPAIDSTVRTHTYTLRKKLESYYRQEGKNDTIRFVIPKGNYRIDFVSLTHKKTNKTFRPLPFIVILAVVLFGSLIYYLITKNIELEKKFNDSLLISSPHPIWSDFLDSDLPTVVVIGDYYFFQEKKEKNSRERFIRDVRINESIDLEDYFRQNPKDAQRFSKTPLTYLGEEVPWCLWEIYKVFQGNNAKLQIKLASDLLISDLQENNIIFIGHFKTIRILDLFFNNLRYKIQLFPHRIYYTPDYTDTLDVITLESYYRYGFHDDFAITAKFPGGHQNTILLLTSFSAFGKIEAMKKLTSQKFQGELLNSKLIKDSEIPQFFEILFRIHGVEKTGFYTEIIHFDEIHHSNVFGIKENYNQSNKGTTGFQHAR